MSLKNKVTAFGLSAAMLLSPAASLAESNYAAGELTTTAISDSYVAGNQLNLSAGFRLELGDVVKSLSDKKLEKKLDAVVSLMEATELHMSFYDDFGTARIHAEIETDGLTIFSADALAYANGSVQMMTNLTGKLVLALPEGALASANFEGLLSGVPGKSADDPDFDDYPAMERLRITASDVGVLMLSHLLGWVSGTQMDTGELYVFDDTYLDATETRDAVAQRMVGTIDADKFNTLFWNISATICETQGKFQQALADVLAENGVTRYQARQVIDSIFKDEQIDPAVDYVQPSHAVADDGALCTYNDVSYFFKKLVKYTNNAWEYSTDNVLKMIVSYDDFGETVGFDAEMPQFTEVVPYEGAFTYSVKHDENEQPIVTSHGELQLLNDQRLVGDVKAKNGLDVNGVKDSSLNGYLDLKDTKADTAMGLGVNSVSHFVVEPDDDGADVEHFTGSVALSYRDNGEDEYSLIAAVEGNTKTDGDAFATLADVSLTLTDIFKLGANVTLEQADYEEIEFAGGQAIDMTQLTDAQLDQIQNEVTQQAAKLSASLVMHPGVLANLLALVGD